MMPMGLARLFLSKPLIFNYFRNGHAFNLSFMNHDFVR